MKFLRTMCALMLAASPAFALTDSDWIKRIYGDLLLRPPTAQEMTSATLSLAFERQADPDPLRARMMVALALVRSDEWIDNLTGANPFIPGYAQLLVGPGLVADARGAANAAYYRCQFQKFHWEDEQIIASVISSTQSDSCEQPNRFLNFRTPSFDLYQTRALALHPDFFSCGGGPAIKFVIDQIYLDLLGRHANNAELALPGSDDDQIQGTLLALGIGGSIGAPQEQEYLAKMVRSAFLRFYHRLPDERPNTAPDGASELQYYMGLSRGTIASNEWFYALLVSLPEYDTSVPQPPPVVGSALGNILPADVLVQAPSLERFGSAPPTLSKLVSPLFLDGIVNTVTSAATSLSAQVQNQQQALAGQQIALSAQQLVIDSQAQTITALALNAFGGPATRASATALIATAAAKLKEAESIVCGLGSFSCASSDIDRARVTLQWAREALEASQYDEAERFARSTFQSAVRAEQKH